MLCLGNNDIKRIASAEMVLTVPMVIDQGTPISRLKRVVNQESLIEAITTIIIRAMDSFNTGQKISDTQAPILAVDLLELMEHDCIEDVLLMFKYARQGKLGGKIFRIDNHVVLSEWMPAYLELKTIERENQHNKIKSNNNNIVKYDWDNEALENFKALEIGVNAKTNEKGARVRGVGKGMKDWLGSEPLTEPFGVKDNPVNKEFEYQRINKSKNN